MISSVVVLRFPQSIFNLAGLSKQRILSKANQILWGDPTGRAMEIKVNWWIRFSSTVKLSKQEIRN